MQRRSHPKLARILDDVRLNFLAFADFSTGHWTKIWFTNPLDRVSK